MTVDQYILILIFILLFTSILGIVYFFPILFTKIKTQNHGLKLSYEQTRILAKSKCLKNDFIIELKEIWNIYPVQLEKLINLYYAGGDLSKLRNGIISMISRGKEPDIDMLSALNLARKDLLIEIERAEKNNWKFEF